jgi:predicted dehydrogenase
MNKIRAAVIGGGAFGECHLKTYRSMPQVDVAGVYTLEKDRAAELCQKYGGRAYDSLGQLATDPDIDLVSIATPENAHFEAFKALAENKKAIYCEKPLATSMDEARQMLELSRSLTAMSGHCLRFEARVAHVLERKDQMGPLHHMSFKDRRRRSDKIVYGRVHPAYVLLCHEIELANAFAGVPFKRVCALQTHFSAGQVDGLSMIVEYENGATCVIEGGFLLPSQEGVDGNDQITLDFEKGSWSMVFPHSGFNFIDAAGAHFVNQHYENTMYGMEFGALRSALEYMTQCVDRGIRPQISTIEDGYNAVRLVDAAIRSAAEGRWIQKEHMP